MAFYDELDVILNTAVSQLLENQNICKLVYYYPTTVDFKFNPIVQPNISDTNQLLMKNIFPLPKNPDIEIDQKCFINVCIHGGDKPKTNLAFRKVLLVFDIVCHLDAWIIKNSFRPLKILSEIDSMFNNQLTTLPIENKPLSMPFNARAYSDKYYGYQIAYELQVNSNIECGGKNE